MKRSIKELRQFPFIMEDVRKMARKIGLDFEQVYEVEFKRIGGWYEPIKLYAIN